MGRSGSEMHLRVNKIIESANLNKFSKIITKQDYKMTVLYGRLYTETYKMSLLNLKSFYKKRYVNKRLKTILKRDVKELLEETK